MAIIGGEGAPRVATKLGHGVRVRALTDSLASNDVAFVGTFNLDPLALSPLPVRQAVLSRVFKLI